MYASRMRYDRKRRPRRRYASRRQLKKANVRVLRQTGDSKDNPINIYTSRTKCPKREFKDPRGGKRSCSRCGGQASVHPEMQLVSDAKRRDSECLSHVPPSSPLDREHCRHLNCIVRDCLQQSCSHASKISYQA